jgi:hypothetical protein
MILALLGPSVLAASAAMSPAAGPRLDEGLQVLAPVPRPGTTLPEGECMQVHHLRREAALPPAAPVVVPTVSGSARTVRTRSERFGPALASRVRIHAPAVSGAMILPPPVMIRHPKATPSSSRDPTSPAH